MDKERIGTQIDPMTDFTNQRNIDCRETIGQLNCQRTKVWSWGAHAWTNISNLALRFKVSGHHHKGHVYISVNFMDTYDIVYTTSKGKIVDMVSGVYCDELTDVIDRRVEKIAAYED